MIHGILNTIAYGVIIVALLFAMVDTFDRRSRVKQGIMFYLNLQIAILLGIAGFTLLIISLWVG